jgi:hypothetical protein
MKTKLTISAAVLTAALLFSGLFAVSPAQAQIARRVRQPKDLSAALQQSLQDQVSQDAGPYLDKEDENRNTGKLYTDLQQKFEYLPSYGPQGLSTVSVKLGGAEYNPKDKSTSKGAATGKLKYLVFTYERRGSKWVEVGKPKWESQDLGKAAGAEMTSHIKLHDRNQAIIEKQKKKKAALAEALQKKFGSKNGNVTAP